MLGYDQTNFNRGEKKHERIVSQIIQIIRNAEAHRQQRGRRGAACVATARA